MMGWIGIKKRLPLIFAIGTLFVGWQVLTWFYPAYLVPDLSRIFSRLFADILSPSFISTVSISLYRLAVGFSIAFGLGLLLGLLAAPLSFLRTYLRSLVAIIQSVPPIAWIPLLIILLGFGEASILTVIVVAGFSPIVLSILNATEDVSQNRLRLARLLGANWRQLIFKVYVPEIIPALVTGVQIGFGNAWRSLIAAEMVGGVNQGLGWSITFSSEIADMAGVVMGMVIIGTLATLVDLLLIGSLAKRLLKWREA